METNIGAKIQALVGNPDVFQTKSVKDRHKYYKRPGRGHNRDSCDACGDVGDILCCDNCPASFHWDCVDPPMEEEDLPTGGWQCQSCVATKKESETSVLEEPMMVTDDGDDLPIPTTSTELEASGIDAAKALETVFQNLEKYWKKQNPRQFKLPSYISTFEPHLPGFSRPMAKKLTFKNIIVEPDKKSVKRHLTLCYTCDRSSRVGPLIQCDFCPKYYHLDCVDPPLTAAPSVLWSCPLHSEPITESKYLTSTRLSERVRLWDHTQSPVQPVSATLDFVSQAHCSGPKARMLPVEQKLSCKIPSFIANAYRSEILEGPEETTEKDNTGPRKFTMTPPTKTVPLRNDGLQFVNNKKPEEIPGSSKPAAPVSGADAAPLDEADKESKPIIAQQSDCGGLSLLLEAVDALTEMDVVESVLQHLHPSTVKLLAAQKVLETPSLSRKFKKLPVESPYARNIKREPSGFQGGRSLTLVSLKNGKEATCWSSSCEIGSGPDVFFNVSNFGGPCERVASLHTSLFYNRISSKWELINYGTSGTLVNNCLFGCDTEQLPKSTKQVNPVLRHFKEVIDQRKNTLIQQRKLRTVEENRAILNQKCSCDCKTELEPVTDGAYEGSVQIQTGDKIKVGCVTFVVLGVGGGSEQTVGV